MQAFIDAMMPRRVEGPAGSEYGEVCQWCLNPFNVKIKLSGKPRNSIEYERLRTILKISDHTLEPVICDSCFDMVIGSALDAEKVGGMSVPMPGNNLLAQMR